MATAIQRPTIKAVANARGNQLSLTEVDVNGKRINFQCKKCGEIKKRSEFFPCFSPSNGSGVSAICKNCACEVAVDNGDITREGLYALCELLDKPYIEKFYKNLYSIKNGTPKSKIAKYVGWVNQTDNGYKAKGFADSDELPNEEDTEKEQEALNVQSHGYNKEDAIDLFGVGWKEEEYRMLWRKFNMIAKNYPLKTEMHREMLAKYVKYAIREEIAVAQGDEAAAEKWGKMAAKIAQDAKINPNQLSGDDLSDGITCFSALTVAVERVEEPIPILNKYRQEPADMPDYVIWQIVNANRRMAGQPTIRYKDLYEFTEKQAEEVRNEYNLNIPKGFVDYDASEISDEV